MLASAGGGYERWTGHHDNTPARASAQRSAHHDSQPRSHAKRQRAASRTTIRSNVSSAEVRPPSATVPRGPTWSLVPLGVATMLALLLPRGRLGSSLYRVAAQPGAYRQGGTFWSAAAVKAPNSVYPSGLITTGQPIYPSLVVGSRCTSGTSSSRRSHRVKGTIELRALVLSQTDTWQEVSTVVPITKFTGDKTTISSDLPLAGLYGLINSVAVESGITGSSYSVDIQPVVHITGTVDHHPIDETFSPVLPFAVTQTVIRVDAAVAPPPPGPPTSRLPPAPRWNRRCTQSNSAASRRSPPTRSRWPGTTSRFPSFRWLGATFAVLAHRARRAPRPSAAPASEAERRGTVREQVPRAHRAGHLPGTTTGPCADHGSRFHPPRRAAHNLSSGPILYEVRDGYRTFAVDDDTRAGTSLLPSTDVRAARGTNS